MAYLWGSDQPPNRRQRVTGTVYMWLGGVLLLACFGAIAGSTVLLLPDVAGFVGLCGVIIACCLILAGATLRFGGG